MFRTFRITLFVAAIVAALTLTPVSATTATVAVVADEVCGDVSAQAEESIKLLLEAYRAGGGSPEDDIVLLAPVYEDLPDEGAGDLHDVYDLLVPVANDIVDETGVWFVKFYVPVVGGTVAATGGGVVSLVYCHPGVSIVGGAHEDAHCATAKGNDMHDDGYCVRGIEAGIDAVGYCPGVRDIVPVMSKVNADAMSEEFRKLASVPPPQGVTTWLKTAEQPGFEFLVRVTAGGSSFMGTKVPEGECIAETFCVAGALPDRPEVFVKIIGPRPNGFLWVQISRFTPSRVEVWVRQTSTGETNYYNLPAVGGQSDDVSGLQDRGAFLP